MKRATLLLPVLILTMCLDAHGQSALGGLQEVRLELIDHRDLLPAPLIDARLRDMRAMLGRANGPWPGGASDAPRLAVLIDVEEEKGDSASVRLQMQLIDEVLLVRSPASHVEAVTWEKSVRMTTSVYEMDRAVKEGVRSLLRLFITQYKQANQ